MLHRRDTVIYVNRQHPLYQREAQKPDTYLLNVTRLITQEISLMKDTRNPRQAFQRQSKLFRDAFIDRQSEQFSLTYLRGQRTFFAHPTYLLKKLGQI